MWCCSLDADTLIRRPLDGLIDLVHRKQVGRRDHRPHQPLAGQQARSPGLGTAVRTPSAWEKPRLAFEHTGWGYYFTDPRLRYCPAYFNYGVVAAPARLIAQIGPVSEAYLIDFARSLGATSTLSSP